MYRNADDLKNGEELRGYDVCIIGAGATGITMAIRLLSSGLKVLMLESGLPGDSKVPSGNRQELYETGATDFIKKVEPKFGTKTRLRMYGGTTNHFTFWARPFDPIDFKSRPPYRKTGWPIAFDELAPYYSLANCFAGYGPVNYEDIEFWSLALGGHPFPEEKDDKLRPTTLRCDRDSKYVLFQEIWGKTIEQAENITVLFNANVLNIESSSRKDHVAGLKCATIDPATGRQGKQFTVKARSYVLGAGGIESVRLLKLSRELGDNRAKMLGRGFMLHPFVDLAGIIGFQDDVSEEIRNFFRGRPVKLYTRGFLPSGEIGPRADKWFRSWGALMPTPEAMTKMRSGNFRCILTFQQPHIATFGITWEQLPNEKSRLELSKNEVDPVFGQPRCLVDWHLLQKDKDTLKAALSMVGEFMETRGAGVKIGVDVSGGPEKWTVQDPKGIAPGDHHIGGTRMSKKPADGIVNTDLRVHTVDNLYVMGCSVFPTSGIANPTLTILALTLRLSDHLRSKFAKKSRRSRQ